MDNIQKPDWKKYQPSLGQCRKYKGTLRACQSDVVRCPGHAIHSAYSIFISRVLELLHLDQNQVERRIDKNYDPYRLQTTKRN